MTVSTTVQEGIGMRNRRAAMGSVGHVGPFYLDGPSGQGMAKQMVHRYWSQNNENFFPLLQMTFRRWLGLHGDLSQNGGLTGSQTDVYFTRPASAFTAPELVELVDLLCDLDTLAG